MVLLSHVSTQPQTETHYYVKYNMQTQNLKPYNLKIQHMENVNGRCGVRSCFHLLLPAVDAQKKKRKLCLCAILTPKHFQRAIMCPKSDCFIQQPFKTQLQQFEEMNLKNFFEIVLFSLWTWIQTHRHPSCIYCHLVTKAYALCEVGEKWGWILVPSPDGVSSLGKGNRGEDDNFLKPRIRTGHGAHLWKSFGHS